MLSRAQLAVAASVGFLVMAAWLVFLKPDSAALLGNSQRTQPAAIEKSISDRSAGFSATNASKKAGILSAGSIGIAAARQVI